MEKTPPLHRSYLIFAHHHENTTGVGDELVEYLRQQEVPGVAWFRFPFVHSSHGAITGDLFRRKEHSSYRSLVRFYRPAPLSYAKDFLYALWLGFRYGGRDHIFIGTTNILALAGIILRLFGRASKVIYYIIDYTPRRYDNPLLDSLYYAIDRTVCYHSDENWPLNERMITARIEDRGWDSARVRYREVPFGNASHMYDPEEYDRYRPNRIVYMGSILKSKGTALFLPIMESLLRLGLEDVVFECIGGGPDLDSLQKEIHEKGLENHFVIHGSIPDHREMERVLLTCAVAVAPYYEEDKNSFSYYADPGKVKTYLGCGLPVVITDVPPIARILEKREAGMIAEYDADDIAQKIHSFLKDEALYRKYRANAIQAGREFSWNNIFRKALASLE